MVALLRHGLPSAISAARAWPDEEWARQREMAVDAVAFRGDGLFEHREHSADAFDGLLAGLAIMSLAPGGAERVDGWLRDYVAAALPQ